MNSDPAAARGTRVTIVAVDPGPEQSGYCIWQQGRILECGVLPNCELSMAVYRDRFPESMLAMEWIESFGLAVGREVFETVYFCGKLAHSWGGKVLRVPRRACKIYLCGTMQAKDANIRQALLDKIGPKGTKANPGPTYLVRSHSWSALAVGVTAEAFLQGETLNGVVWDE